MGNPLLKPARTGNTNLTYVLKNKYTFQVSYYKVEDFFIDQSYQSPEKLQLLHKTFNIDYTSLLNFTAVIPISFGNIVSSNLIANVYNERYKSNEWFELCIQQKQMDRIINGLQHYLHIKKPNITMNLMAFYRTPSIQGIWDLEDNWCINTGLRYTFAKDKAIVGLQCNDIFESLYPKVKVRFDKQYQNLNQNFYQRNITLSFTYKFNGFKDRTPKESGYFKIWSKLTYHYEQIPRLPPTRFHAVWHCLPANDMQIPWERVFTRYSFPLLLCYQRGVSLLGISEAATRLGLHTTCGRVTTEQLHKAPLPCILHWNQNHFVVLYRIKKGKICYIADPGKGLVTYDDREFKEHWLSTRSNGEEKGIAMFLQPTPAFYKQQEETTKDKRSFRFLLGYLRQYRRYFGQIILGALVGCLLQLIFPFLTQAIVDVGIVHQNLNFIYLILLGQLVLTISRASVDFIRRWILLHISMRINISLVSDFFHQIA